MSESSSDPSSPPTQAPSKTPRPVSSWYERIARVGAQVGEASKAIAAVLVIGGLVGLYFPDTKRWWEIHRPGAEQYFSVGNLGYAPDFNRLEDVNFVHPAWSEHGLQSVDALFSMPGDVMYSSSSPIVGRADSSPRSNLRSLNKEAICVHISDVVLRPFQRRLGPKDPKGASYDVLDGYSISQSNCGANVHQCVLQFLQRLPPAFRDADCKPLNSHASQQCAQIGVWARGEVVTC